MPAQTAQLLTLYRTAEKARDLAPWRWMYETQVFGIKLPDQPHTWYCSIMGRFGEYHSYCFYKGENALFTYVSLQALGQIDSPETLYFRKAMILSQECIQVIFDDYEGVQPESRKRIKSLGLRYSGPKKWVCIEDWSEGLPPWPIQEAMAPVVRDLLEQAMRVATAQMQDPKYIGYWTQGGKMMPIFTAQKTADGLTWTKKRQKVVIPDTRDEPLEPQLDWSALRKFPVREKSLVFGALITFHSIEVPKARPYYPVMYVLVDTMSEQILGVFVEDRDDPKALQQKMFSAFMALEYRPKLLAFGEPKSYWRMQQLMEDAGVQTQVVPKVLPILESISQYMAEHF